MAKTGTFLVTAADDDSAVVRDVAGGQVHTLASNPGVEAGDVLEATVAPEPPLEVTWTVEAVSERRSIPVGRVGDAPGDAARAAAADLDPGEVATLEAEDAETHVIAVSPGDAADAAADVVADEAARAEAARLDAVRVEVRAGEDLVAVRYRR
jgi:hypothetical protein